MASEKWLHKDLWNAKMKCELVFAQFFTYFYIDFTSSALSFMQSLLYLSYRYKPTHTRL